MGACSRSIWYWWNNTHSIYLLKQTSKTAMKFPQNPCFYSSRHKTCYPQISWITEVTRYGLGVILSLWNLRVPLQQSCWGTCQILGRWGQCISPILRLRDLTRFGSTISYPVVNRGSIASEAVGVNVSQVRLGVYFWSFMCLSALWWWSYWLAQWVNVFMWYVFKYSSCSRQTNQTLVARDGTLES